MAEGGLPVSACEERKLPMSLPVGHTVQGLESTPRHGVFMSGSCPAHTPSLRPTGFVLVVRTLAQELLPKLGPSVAFRMACMAGSTEQSRG